MSTAGKVLSGIVLALSILLVWVSASYTKLEHGYQQIQKKNLEDLDKATLELEKVELALAEAKQKMETEQFIAQDEITVKDAQLADLEKTRSQVLEAQSRVKIQFETMEATSKAALANQEQRKADLEAEIKAKEDAIASVKKLTQENEELLAELDGLRKKFETDLASNRKKYGLSALNLSQ